MIGDDDGAERIREETVLSSPARSAATDEFSAAGSYIRT